MHIYAGIATVPTWLSYTRDLKALAECRTDARVNLPRAACIVSSPLRVAAWVEELKMFPDREFVNFLIDGITVGFRIGYKRKGDTLVSATRNMLSAEVKPSVISEYLDKELRLGRVVGPLPGDTAVHVSRFGVVPKSSQPGKWRLIVDLSAPENHSVNDGISPESCSLTYTTVECAAELIMKRGRGALLAKIDIESAYRNVPVHPEDRFLLGMRWKGLLYIDTCLPFGLRSAPKIFTALADALCWIVTQHGVRDVIHYLDDYLVVGDPGSSECEVALNVSLQLCERLGVPIAEKKLQRPTTSLSFLGIELDTVSMELRLPQEKLHHLKDLIQGGKRGSLVQSANYSH